MPFNAKSVLTYFCVTTHSLNTLVKLWWLRKTQASFEMRDYIKGRVNLKDYCKVRIVYLQSLYSNFCSDLLLHSSVPFSVCSSSTFCHRCAVMYELQERSQRLYHVEANQNIWRIKRYLTLLLYFSDSE